MAHLKYYQEENKRWVQLYKSPMRFCEAEEAICRWVAHYGKVQPVVLVTRGNRMSSYNRTRHRIRLNMDWADWLTVAHEMAHILAPRKTVDGRKTHWHGSEHAEFVDILCRWILREGWHTGNLAHELALGEDAQRQRVVVRERVAACTAPIELRIQKREQQVKRLSTKIKALTTRLKTANRSLASLRRSASRIKGEL
jgi:hypothetical protein